MSRASVRFHYSLGRRPHLFLPGKMDGAVGRVSHGPPSGGSRVRERGTSSCFPFSPLPSRRGGRRGEAGGRRPIISAEKKSTVARDQAAKCEPEMLATFGPECHPTVRAYFSRGRRWYLLVLCQRASTVNQTSAVFPPSRRCPGYSLYPLLPALFTECKT